MKYLLDTDWSIHCLHRVERVVTRLAELRPEGVGVSIISLAELCCTKACFTLRTR